MSFGPEWLIVLGVVVLLFGAKKLPELARSLGRSQSEFKQGMKEGSQTVAEPAAPATDAQPRRDATQQAPPEPRPPEQPQA